MRYLSVCSGIEAASVAWHELGWEPVAFSEIEPFPSEVLKIRFPHVPNWGDMTKYKNWPDATINLLVGGTPCQSFSVAGLRQGLKDPRGNLMLTFLAIAERYKPRWIVWENVPGVLSSNGGKDFGSFLGALGELGYGWAYRVLDAQWFGVAQRRRRVFVVGCLGDQRAAAQVLFESESVSRNPAPSREKRQSVATSPAPGVGGGGGGQTASTVTTRSGGQYMPDKDNFGAVLTVNTRQFLDIQENVTGTLLATDHKEPQAVVIDRAAFNQGENAQYEPKIEESETMPSLVARGPHGVAQPITIDRSSVNMGYDFNRDLGIEQSGVTPTILATGPHSVAHAFKIRGGSPTETGEYGGTPGKAAGKGYLGSDDLAFTIAASQDQHIAQPIAVDCYNQTVNEHTTQTIGSSASDANHVGAVLQDNTKYSMFANKGIDYASSQKANPVKTLSLLREKIGEKAFAQWGLGILNSLQSTQILQSDLHGIDVRPASFSKSWTIYCALSRKENDSSWLLQSLREAECERYSPQGWELSEQFHRELSSYLQELSCQGASPKRFMQDLWESDEGFGLLRKALSKIQKTWESSHGKNKSTSGTMLIRRLVPIETELLQGFPRNWTLIPWKKKPIEECPDGPRYKACGNSMAVPCMRWIGKRIADAQAKIQ